MKSANKMIDIWHDQIKVAQDGRIHYSFYVYNGENLNSKLEDISNSDHIADTKILLLEKELIELQLSIFILKSANITYSKVMRKENKNLNLSTITSMEEYIIEIKDMIENLKNGGDKCMYH